MAFPRELLVARVATADGDIDAAVEAKAIRWAVNRGARVINLSIGGSAIRCTASATRSPRRRRTPSPMRTARASSSSRPSATATPRRLQPWPFASYPAALPHVIGVSAVSQSGSVPGFSNRDAVFNDLGSTWPGARVDDAAQAHRRAAGLRRPGLLDLCAAPTTSRTA